MRADGRPLAVVLAWVLLTAASPAEQVRKGDYAGALVQLQAQESRRPGDATVKRDLGITLWRSGNPSGALPKLQEARRLKPKDGLTLYFLGRAAEDAALRDTAIEAYGAYLAKGGRQSPEVRARLQDLTRASLHQHFAAVIPRERQLKPGAIPPNTIIVPEFALAGAPDSLRPLARGLALIVTTDLKNADVPDLRVLEREQIDVLQEELQRAKPAGGSRAVQLSPVRKESAPRTGMLLGARQMAQGGLTSLDASKIFMQAELFDAAAGTSKSSGPPVDGALPQVLSLEKTLVYQVLDSLGAHVTPEMRRRIGPPPTQSFPAFLAFSRGLDFEARGMRDQALAAYAQSLKIDPHFTLAQVQQQTLAVEPKDQHAFEAKMVEQAFPLPGSSDRLARSGAELGLLAVPEPRSVSLTPASKTGASVVVITGVVPR